MLKHVVMWKLKDFAEDADRARNAKRIKIELEALKNTIPQIFHLEVGINFLESAAAYDVALFSVFKTEKDLELYQNHPDHRAVAEFVAKVNESRVVVDYKTL
jgi:Stress responsive A/B Barrel Domain